MEDCKKSGEKQDGEGGYFEQVYVSAAILTREDGIEL